ncbi:hypothetical protein, partial [Pseudogemmobacter bohemicus]|uniref:hypothetical protein n=1 Tax=Pseudogemmobacter bohemicus TaxID=2250708 RepID=UPI001E398FDB
GFSGGVSSTFFPAYFSGLLHGFSRMRNIRGYGTARVSPEKSDAARYLSEPVSDYWQALHRVWGKRP